jgi:hypothetical protein
VDFSFNLQLSNHPFIAASLSEGEAKVFESVEDLDVTFIDEAGGFKIELVRRTRSGERG